jgi:acetylornithine/N-succinyldiaminopimelate aminotransferase
MGFGIAVPAHALKLGRGWEHFKNILDAVESGPLLSCFPDARRHKRFWGAAQAFWEGAMVTAVMPTYGRADVSFDRGEGAYIFDSNGRRYLDFGAGIAVTCLGHANPRLIAAVTEQAGKLWHCSNLYQIPGQTRLAEKLVKNSFADTVFFGNSGAEANEGAIKIARKYQSATGHPERYRIITFEGAFHGRTLATLAAGGQKKHLDGFGPVVQGFDQVNVGDIKAVQAAVTKETAAIMIEPIQGEGGIRNVAPEFLEQLRTLCDLNGLMLIFDEVQTGMGRTGKLFAYEWSGVKPDIMSLGKGLGGGFPIGAVLATEKAAVGMTPGTHGSTYGGNPLASAAGNAVIDTLTEPGFLEHVRETAGKLWRRLQELRRANDSVIEDLRGMGLLIGMKIRGINNSDMVKALRAEGLLAVEAGDNVVRLAPALIVGDKEVDEAMAILERVCRSLASKAGTAA